MDYSKVIVSDQKEKSISIQKVKNPPLSLSPYLPMMTSMLLNRRNVHRDAATAINNRRRRRAETQKIGEKGSYALSPLPTQGNS